MEKDLPKYLSRKDPRFLEFCNSAKYEEELLQEYGDKIYYLKYLEFLKNPRKLNDSLEKAIKDLHSSILAYSLNLSNKRHSLSGSEESDLSLDLSKIFTFNKKTILDILINKRSLLSKGHFKLSSGLHSRYYFQAARLFTFPYIGEILAWEIKNLLVEFNLIENINLVCAPAMGGKLIGYEIARSLDIENIFVERVNKKFELRRGFQIADYAKIIITEDVLTTGKSTKEVIKLINNINPTAKVIAISAIVNRSNSNELLFEDNIYPIISLSQLNITTYSEDKLPDDLKNIPITAPGSRFLQVRE